MFLQINIEYKYMNINEESKAKFIFELEKRVKEINIDITLSEFEEEISKLAKT